MAAVIKSDEATLPALDYVRAIAPYQAGKPIEELARENGLAAERIVKLASNENPLGMPASARAAMVAALADLGRYPDANGFALKAALSAKFGVPADWITLGNGSNDILELVAGAFLAPGRSCVYSQYSFAVYALATQARGAQAIVVAARDFGHDLEAMLAAIRADTRLMYVANPNNPTGTFIDAATMESFLGRVPPGVAVVLDEAYNEYLPPEDRFDSTIYGLAQPALTDLLNRVRQPFNVNTPAQAAALAALGDQAFLQQSYELNRAGLREFEAAFDSLGLSYVPSRANFVLVKVGAAARVYQELLKRGVIVRPVGNYGLPEWLRVSVGLPAENATFLAALPPALAAARG